MEPLPVPERLKVYLLLKQSGVQFTPVGMPTVAAGFSSGFFFNMQEAEQHRTIESLKETNPAVTFHIFELSIPNPAYKK